MARSNHETPGGLMNRRGFLRTGIAAGGLLAAPGVLRAQSDDLRIGWIRPLTGPLASSFEALYAAGDIAVDEINAAGGVLGRKIVKIEVDDQGAPAQQPLAMRQLVNEGVDIVVGPVGSSQTLASLAISTPENILQSGYITASEGGQGERYPYHYQCVFTVATQAVKYAEWISRNTEFKKVGVLVEDSAAGTSVLAASEVELARAGLTMTQSRVFPLKSTDMTPFLRDMRNSGAEALCVFASNSIDVIQFFVGLDRIGWKPPVVGHTGLVFASAPDAVPESARYPEVYAATYKALTYAGDEEPSDRVKAYIGKILQLGLPTAALPPAATSPYYDFLHVVAHAAEETQSVDPKDLKAYLDQLSNYEGIFGPMSFTADNHTGYGPDAAALAQVFAEPNELLTSSQGLFRPRG